MTSLDRVTHKSKLKIFTVKLAKKLPSLNPLLLSKRWRLKMGDFDFDSGHVMSEEKTRFDSLERILLLHLAQQT